VLYDPHDDFPGLLPLRLEWRALREEAIAAWTRAPLLLDGPHRGRSDWSGDDDFFLDQLDVHGWVPAWRADAPTDGREDDRNEQWLNYGLVYNGHAFGRNQSLCPRMAALLDPLAPWINVAGLSLMRPLSRIHRHVDSTGASTQSLAYHLGLVVPGEVRHSCKLVVDGLAMYEEEGRALVFDANRPHYAENNSVGERIILYIDFRTSLPPLAGKDGMARSESVETVILRPRL
jgi:beta-hydroxylase